MIFWKYRIQYCILISSLCKWKHSNYYRYLFINRCNG